MTQLKRTAFYDRHVAAGAKMVEFGGWEMPIQYGGGIVTEHLATRKRAGCSTSRTWGASSCVAKVHCLFSSTS
jgi:glycine cleavage system aminomethyltransferase T